MTSSFPFDEYAKKSWEQPPEATPDAKPEDDSASGGAIPDKIVRLARERYRFGITAQGEAFAVLRDGPNVALMWRGSQDSLRATLAKAYLARYGKVAKSSALTDAMMALQGEAQDQDREDVYLRIASLGDQIILDLGDASGRAVKISPHGWDVLERSPVLFRRSELTGALPVPVPGDIAELRTLLNVTDSTWPLLLGWLVAAFIPNIPHPILLMGGEHGTGKSTAARYIMGLFDASPAPLRSCPRDAEQWAIAAAGSWGVAIDNVSTISDWWSDALCKAVTGDGWTRRTLYSNSGLTVLAFRRVIALTSIEAGALRGDLGDRIVLVDLIRIDRSKRRTEVELDRAYASLRPELLGGLLTLVSRVLAVLPSIRLSAAPRMADFAHVLAAMDKVLSTSALALYEGQGERVASDVLESDPVGLALLAFAQKVGSWEGNASELHAALTPAPVPRDWPRSGRILAGRIRRLDPALRVSQAEVIAPAPGDHKRIWQVRWRANDPQIIAPIAPSPPEEDPWPPSASPSGGGSGDVGDVGGDSRASSPLSPSPGPPSACYACGRTAWWSMSDLMNWTCGSCHTAPEDGRPVIHWHGNRRVA